MHISLAALQTALASDWHFADGWRVVASRHVAPVTCRATGAQATVVAVHCDVDGMATASLAREVGVLECVAFQQSAVPLLATGRQAGWLYAIVPDLPVSVADVVAREGAQPLETALPAVIGIANLLHFCHSQGIAHGSISAAQLFRHDGQVVLGGFASAVRFEPASRAAQALVHADVHALARTLVTLVCGPAVLPQRISESDVDPLLLPVLQRALDADDPYPTAIAFAQALCGVQEALDPSLAEVEGREAAWLEEPPLTDGAERSLAVLHALLDRAEVMAVPPEPDDPLVQRCWARAEEQVGADDARLVALRCRWQLLAALDPVGALSASQAAAGAPVVRPYRARALAALGHAAQARALAVRAWFEDVSLDMAALRSVTMALLLTRAFDLATLVTEAEGPPALSDPVIAAAGQVAREHGAAAPMSAGAQRRTLRDIASAMDRRVPWTAELQADPRWDALRSDPQFTALVARARRTWTSAAVGRV